MQKKKVESGFTLVELLLVIAIIGILAAVLFVGLGKQRERARLTTFKENMRGLVTAATACTDGGGEIYTGIPDGDDPLCKNGPSGIGNVPTITDCDGDGTVELVSEDVFGDTWYLQATCTTGANESCVANCSPDGCVFCNEELTYSDGAWESACSSDTHCQ